MTFIGKLFEIKDNTYTKKVFFLFVLSLLMSMLSVFIRIPASWSDEQIHYYRAVQVAHGDLFKTSDKDKTKYGGEVSESQSSFMDSNFEIIANPNNKQIFGFDWINQGSSIHYSSNKEFKETTTTVPYNPVVYIPYIVPVWIGDLFRLSPVIIFIMMRLFGVLIAYVLMFIAIKNLPFSKLTIAAFLLHPTLILGFSAITADTLTNALIILFISYFSKIIYQLLQKNEVSKKENLILSLLILLLSVSKMPAFFVVLLALPLLYLYFKNQIGKKFSVTIILSVVASVAIVFTWLLSVRHINTGVYFGRDVDTFRQIQYILSDIPRFIRMYISSILSYNYFDMQLGYANSPLYLSIPTTYVVLYYIGIVFSLFQQDNTISEVRYSESYFVQFTKNIILLAVIAVTFLILYLQFSLVGSNIIEGVQPRYFVPYFLLLLTNKPVLTIQNKKISNISLVFILAPYLIYIFFVVSQIF